MTSAALKSLVDRHASHFSLAYFGRAGLAGAAFAACIVACGGNGVAKGGGSGASATSAAGGVSGQTGDSSTEAGGDSGSPGLATGVATAGSPCTSSGAGACAGNAQKVTLICGPDGVWSASTRCSSTENCDTRPGATQGTCAAIDPACAGASPGANVCGSVSNIVQCGADLVSDSLLTVCFEQVCHAATCVGVCVPPQVNKVPCGNCGTDTQTCTTSGTWQTGGCMGEGICASLETQACNVYGTQGCGAACAWGTCTCAAPPVCVPVTTQCSGPGVQTCDACGQWSPAVTCGGAAPSCSQGACLTPPVAPPSCQSSGAGSTDCGASGKDSCCTSPEIPASTYNQVYSNDGAGPTDPQSQAATVSGLRMDAYLVTVGRFRQFVAAYNAGYTPPAGSGKHTHLNQGNGLNATGAGFEPGWLTTDDSHIDPTDANLNCDSTYATWTPAAGGQENVPINCVNWYESYAFCIWDGGFLPSAAELRCAQAAGSAEWEYPWGSTPPGTKNQYAIFGCYYPNEDGICAGVGNIAPVGTASLGAGLWGQFDLSGDMSQWNLDWFETVPDPCVDCAALDPATERTTIGRAFDGSDFTDVPVSVEGDELEPSGRNHGIGVRCARVP